MAAQGYEVRVFNLIDPSQSDGYNPFSYIHSEKDVLTLIDTVVAAAITSRKAKNSLPTHILLENVPGLAPTSLLLLEQLRTIDRKRLRGYIGHISKEKMLEVDAALAISIGIGYPNKRRIHNV